VNLTYSPTTDAAEIDLRLSRLLRGGSLDAPVLHRRIERLAASFERYAAAYPLPLWAPGLLLDQEMRAVTESVFPLAEASRAFRAVLSAGCRFAPLWGTTILSSAASWLDVLQGLYPLLGQGDPAPVLATLAADGDARRDFLFTLFLPRRYGASFDRYPLQDAWLGRWLSQRRGGARKVRALDCACGSGEGTYRLAEVVAQSCGAGSTVDGSTFEPVELFAAAHAYFPHDAQRQRSYRERIAPLQESGVSMRFYLDDVAAEGEGEYDVILCNGLLGGPMLWERDEVREAVRKLAGRLAAGGVLLAADRFHAGWKRRLPGGKLEELLKECALTPVPVPEGIAATKAG